MSIERWEEEKRAINSGTQVAVIATPVPTSNPVYIQR
jgi:hypothetical protein